MSETLNSSEQSTNLEAYAGLSGKIRGLKILEDLHAPVPRFTFIPSNFTEHDIAEILASDTFSKSKSWAVRSSANVEDSQKASFAGLFDSYMAIKTADIAHYVELVRSSAKTESVEHYCAAHNINPDTIQMDVIVQEFEEPVISGVWMGNADGGGILEWVEGRGENLVSGKVTPTREEYHNVAQALDSRKDAILTDENGQTIVRQCMDFTDQLGYPLDLEFCILPQKLCWVQLRPVTAPIKLSSKAANETQGLALKGETVSSAIGNGISHRFDQVQGEGWRKGLVLVAKETTPAMMKYLMTSEGVVTEIGGKLSHAAVVCRELGKACLVGVDITKIPHGESVQVDGVEGVVRVQADHGIL